MKLYTDRDEEDEVWQVRESGLGSTARVPGRPDTWPGWEDSAVAPEKLGGYLRDLRRLFTRYGYRPSLYGHFGQGCVHCRVDFDVVTSEGVAKFRSFLREAAELCAGYGGSLSGEHGDGQARAEFLPIMYGEELVAAFRAFKAIWDPKGKMNPGKVVDPDPVDANLRLGPDYAPAEPATRFAFADDDGSFERATLRCVGIGKCRRAEGGVMCPSYMVTGEEMHSTRGRAHLLHEMLRGDPLGGGWRDEHVKEALELCLACKGCKSDCPINVDMATYKAEFLSHYYEGRLRPRPAYAMGLIHWWARLAALAPGVANFVTQTPGVSAVAKLLAGAHPKRRIPAFARETFRAWFRRRPAKNIRGPKVILWPDTFNDHFHPETARAAVEVLEAAGFRVLVPPAPLCCGRPLYDYGFVDIAKRLLVRTIEALRPEIAAGTPLVGLEPSCLAVFRDEMTGLLPHDRDAARLRRQSFTLAELLTKRAAGFEPPRLARRAIVQTHCHQHAIMKFDADREILRKMGLDFEVLDSGCCGMAGSFGYERGKYDVSMACGERVLLPRVRAAEKDVLVLADGFSCREQIAEGTDRRALHLSLVLQMALKEGSGGPPGPYPEHGYVTTQPALGSPAAARRRAMAAGAAGLAAAVAIAAMARARRA
jgi:Fe-S oxidoreductase